MRVRTLLVGVVILGAACGLDRASRPHEAGPGVRAGRGYSLDAALLRGEGRIAVDADGSWRFAWPASGFRFRFRGTGARARLEDRLMQDAIRDTDLLAVFVDDRPAVVRPLREGGNEIVLAEGLPEGDHTIRVLKRTESEQGTVVLQGLALQGLAPRLLATPEARPLRLLAIGDSITAGYGIDGPDERCHFSATTEDATRTYPFLTAQALSAEYQAIAWSGRGLARNLDPSLPETMPVLFERRLAGEETPGFDPAAFVPDVVLVNLGTNDFALPSPDPGAILAAYRGLLARVRATAPAAEIVVAVGPMLADDYPPGSRALSRMRRIASEVVAERTAAGDARIATLELPGASPDEGYGCDYHPSRATHARLAGVVIQHLRPRLRARPPTTTAVIR